MIGNSIDILAMWTPGPLELIIIAIVALLVFGKRLPEIARGLGKSLIEFKKGVSEAKNTKDELLSDVTKVKDELEDEVKDAAEPNDSDKNEIET